MLSSDIQSVVITLQEHDATAQQERLRRHLRHGITPILCCGESLEQREQGVTMDWIRLQIKISISLDVTADQVKSMQLSLTSQSGLSEQVRQLHQIRHRKYVQGIRECHR